MVDMANMTTTGTYRNGRAAGVVLGAATVAMGLIAGSFYVFACAVMPALARSGDRTYVEVMRNTNEVIQNPVFFLSFLGALVLTGIAAWQLRTRWVYAALLAYAAAFLITVAVNVPLNDALARPGDPTVLRENFEAPWVAWNITRALLCTAATGFLARALVVWGRARPQG
ncbi:DUF1772 domain-containing protein [Streptomyces sp. NPDC091292]|uniref:anthrone oxygenase family protein n=1 Tax=Streptomyces sp. NPDC091292 TaxID=3365991 RepID=UPI003821C38C